MLKTVLDRLKGSGTEMDLEEVRSLSSEIAQLVPQGSMRRGFVGDLGELWACALFKLSRMPEGQRGYDAADRKGTLGGVGEKYQVKSRSPEKGRLVNSVGTVGTFTSFDFDGALLVLLDKDLQVYEVWLSTPADIRQNLRRGRRDITVGKFKQIGRRVFSGS